MDTITTNTQSDINQIKALIKDNPELSEPSITALYLQNKKSEKAREIGDIVAPILIDAIEGAKEIKEHFLPS